MFTESYHPPTKLTPKLAEEIVKLSERIVPPGPNRKQLAGSIERHCFEELILVSYSNPWDFNDNSFCRIVRIWRM